MNKTMIVAIAILAMVLGIVAYASAATATYDITVNAKVNPKLNLTVTPAGASNVLDWTLDPGATASESVGIVVDSNLPGTLTAAWDDVAGAAAYNLTKTLVSDPIVKAQNQNFTDTIEFQPDWTTDTTAKTFKLTYTATVN